MKSSSKVKNVCIITGTYNTPSILLNFFITVIKNTPFGFQFILVNNGKDKATEETIKYYKQFLGKNMKVLRLDNQYSFAKWNNLALKKTKKKYILYLNNDVLLSPSWLESMVEVLDKKRKIGAVSKRMFGEKGESDWHCGEEVGGEVESAPATCLLVRRELAGFDRRFEGYYFEDEVLIENIKRKGYKIWAEREHPIIHIGRVTFNKLPKSKQIELVNLNDKIRKISVDK